MSRAMISTTAATPTPAIASTRGVLSSTVQRTALREGYADVSDLPAGADFFTYQKKVIPSADIVPSHIAR